MKTNQILEVNFGGHRMQIEHKTGMGNLTELWGIGNEYRKSRGLAPLDLDNWLRRPQTEEFIRVVEQDLGIENVNDSKSKDSNKSRINKIKSPLIKTKRGRYGGTYAHFYIMLEAMMHLQGGYAKVKIFSSIKDAFSVLNALENFEVDDEIVENSTKELFVYAIREVNTGNIKLGISSDPESRLNQLQVGNSSKLELVAYKTASSFKDEKRQHRLNGQHHVRGEWFNSNARLIG